MTDLASMCYRNLILPVPFIPIECEETQDGKFHEIYVYERQINRDMVDWLGSIGLRAMHGRYFYSPSTHRYNLHVDILENPDEYAYLNFVFGGKGSAMNWYSLKTDQQKFTITNAVGKKIYGYKEEDCEIINTNVCLDSYKNFATLINAGIIHTMINPSEERRCYSWVLYKEKRVCWHELADIFKPWFIS